MKHKYLVGRGELGPFGFTVIKTIGYISRARKVRAGSRFNCNGKRYTADDVSHYRNPPPGFNGRIIVAES